jgi:hypothetical protein
MPRIDYIPIRTSGNAVVLGVIVRRRFERLRRLLKL